MSRSKKSRKPGAMGAPDVIVTRNRTESDVEGRLRKRLKKRKGLKSGSRHSAAEENKLGSQGQKRDPRLGSKKKIPLIVEAPKKQTKADRRMSAAQELEMLENDAQLMVLLDRIEAGETLGAGLQKQVDDKLDRIEKLMKQLGIFEEEAAHAELDAFDTKSERTQQKSDEELLSEFDDFDLDEFKG